MGRAAVSLAMLALLSAWNLPAREATDQSQSQKKSQAKKKIDSMTGCVDQQDGRYVLLNEQTRATVADLEAEGFPTEGFAKHVGQKVTVRGTSNPGTERPLFRVRSVETISETCEPQALK